MQRQKPEVEELLQKQKIILLLPMHKLQDWMVVPQHYCYTHIWYLM